MLRNRLQQYQTDRRSDRGDVSAVGRSSGRKRRDCAGDLFAQRINSVERLMKFRPNNNVNAPIARYLLLSVSLCVCGVVSAAEFAETGSADVTSPGRKSVMRIGAAQPRSRLDRKSVV